MLPVQPKIGGKGSLKLKTDMTGISGGKPTKAKVAGKMSKNPGSKGARKKA